MLEWRDTAEKIVAGRNSISSMSDGASPNHSGRLVTILSTPPILSGHIAGKEHLLMDAPSSPRGFSSSPRGDPMMGSASMFAKLKLLGKKSEFSGRDHVPMQPCIW